MPPPTVIEAELISTGSELLSGRTVNRHAHTLGGALRTLGIDLVRDTTLPDDPAAITAAVRDALARVPLVLVTGGLGPTSDDITRDAVAAALGRTLVVDEGSRAHLESWFARNHRPMTESALRQALVITGADVLPNRAGIAPGQRVVEGGKVLFLLPGPPRELKAILDDHVLPDLRARYATAAPVIEEISMFAALGESDLQMWMNAQSVPPSVAVGYCASPGILEFRLTTHDPAAALAVAALSAAARAAFQPCFFANRRAGLEEVVADLLKERGETLSLAESCTGGLVGALLTSLPGSSAWFSGGVICYSNDSKVRDLGVSPATLGTHGAVSEGCAREMAEGARARFQTTWAVSVTGIAGPGGGSPGKPVGTVCLAVAGPGEIRTAVHKLNGDRETVRESACHRALLLLWRSLS